MLKIAICDDDKKAAVELKDVIRLYEAQRANNEAFLIDVFLSGVSLLDKFNDYDLIFLDIDMPGLNGISAAKRIRATNLQVGIIYVTSHYKYTLEALAVHAFNYLTKPFSNDQLFLALDEYQGSLISKEPKKIFTFITDNPAWVPVCLEADSILYFECEKRQSNGNIKVVTVGGVLHIRSTIKELASITEPYAFVASHKSFIVNMAHIWQIKGFAITMDNGDEVVIAQKKASEFRTIHNRYIQKL